jgi:uncharacterized protein YegL
MNNDCPICFDPLLGHALFTTTCGHVFHFDCIIHSMKHGVNTLCPLCRNNVPELLSGTQFKPLEQPDPSTTSDGANWHPTMDDFEEQSLVSMVETSTNSSLKLELISEYQTVTCETSMDLVARVSTVGTQGRAPVDIVAVIDKSASMRGDKITMVKRILEFILHNLNEHDRLSIVTFDKQVYGLFGLNRCGQNNLKDRIRTSEYLIPSGGTNIKAGLERGLKVLTDRNERNPITAMLLLTDGQGTIPTDEELDQLPEIPIHCFGVGSDHDARVLNRIAERTNGSYVFIEQTHEIRDTIALCLGSLLSIAGQELKITITAPELQVKTSYPSTTTENSATITIPNILFEEHKDILFSCRLPSEPINFCSARGWYRDHISDHVIDEVKYSVLRGPERDLPCLYIDQERNRMLAIETLKEAVSFGESDQLEQARDRLITSIDQLKNSLTANEPTVQIMILDLQTCLDRFQDHNYSTSGYCYAEQQYRSHSLQRTVNISTPSSYLTRTQSKYLN